MTNEELKKMVDDEKKSRETACAAEMQELFKKHNCVLDVRMVLGANKHPEVITVITAK